MSTHPDSHHEPAAVRRRRKARPKDPGGASRSARARKNRQQLGRPDRRAVDVAFGDSVVSALQRSGAVQADGSVDEAVLARRPDLAAVYTEALADLTGRFNLEQVAEVVQARLGVDLEQATPDQPDDHAAILAAWGQAVLSAVAKLHPDLLEERTLGKRGLALTSIFNRAVDSYAKEADCTHEEAVRTISLSMRRAIVTAERTDASAPATAQ